MNHPKTKILLINPGQYMPAKISFPLNAFQPLGLGYIASVLLKSNYQTNIFDVLAEGYDHEELIEKNQYRYAGLPKKTIKDRVRKYSPDIVGITIPFTAQAKAGHEMARMVKSINPQIRVVVGGAYPTTHADLILKDTNIDFAVKGEGELTFLELVKKIEKNRKTFNHIPGLVFRHGKRIIINPPRPPLMDLDHFSVAWHLLPMEKYFQAALHIKSSRSISTFGKRWATIFTSRGCPYSCTFCAGRLVMGQGWRPRSVKNVIEEMAYLIQNYKIQHFDIEDDNFTLDKQRAKTLCRQIIKNKWKIEWSTPNGIRADTVDRSLIKTMKQSGCTRIIVAPESGNQWVVNHLMNKRIDLKKVKQVVTWCRQYHLPVDAFFLIGMPGETETQIMDTIRYAKELRQLGARDCGFGVLVPHRGTQVYEIAVKNGWLRQPDPNHLTTGLMIGEPTIETPQLSLEKTRQLFQLAKKVNPLIPYSHFRLTFYLLTHSPTRFIKLSLSYLAKQLGLSPGLLGT